MPTTSVIKIAKYTPRMVVVRLNPISPTPYMSFWRRESVFDIVDSFGVYLQLVEDQICLEGSWIPALISASSGTGMRE
jgi:hypothetical protein